MLPEIVLNVLSFCDLRSIYLLCATCCRFYGLATETNLLPILRRLVPSRNTTNLTFPQVLLLCRYPYSPPRITVGLDGISFLKEGKVCCISWTDEIGGKDVVNKGNGDIIDISVCEDLFCALTSDNCISCWTIEGFNSGEYQLGFDAVQVSIESSLNDEWCSIIVLSSDNQMYHMVWDFEKGCTKPRLYQTGFPIYRLSGWKLVDFNGNVLTYNRGSNVVQMVGKYVCGSNPHKNTLEKRGVVMERVQEVYSGGDGIYYLVLEDGGVEEVDLTDEEDEPRRWGYSYFSF